MPKFNFAMHPEDVGKLQNEKQEDIIQSNNTYTQFIRNPTHQVKSFKEDIPKPMGVSSSNFTILQQHQVVRPQAYQQPSQRQVAQEPENDDNNQKQVQQDEDDNKPIEKPYDLIMRQKLYQQRNEANLEPQKAPEMLNP